MEKEKLYEGKERRRSIRWYENIPGELIFISEMVIEHTQEVYRVELRNISSLGVCIKGKLPEDMGRDSLLSGIIKVGLRWHFTSQGECLTLGKIAWLDSTIAQDNTYFLGIEFLEITTTTVDKIKQFVIDSYWSKNR